MIDRRNDKWVEPALIYNFLTAAADQ